MNEIMEIRCKIKKDSALYEKGQALIQAAYEYWKEYQKSYESYAVVWLKDSSGHMVLFTRGEYMHQLMGVVDKLDGEEQMEKPFEDR